MIRARHTPEAQIFRATAPQGHLSSGPPLFRATFCPGSAGTSGRAEEAFVSRLTIRQLAIRRLTIKPISPAPPSPPRLRITSLRDHKPLVIAPRLRSAPSTTSATRDLRDTGLQRYRTSTAQSDWAYLSRGLNHTVSTVPERRRAPAETSRWDTQNRTQYGYQVSLIGQNCLSGCLRSCLRSRLQSRLGRLPRPGCGRALPSCSPSSGPAFLLGASSPTG